MVRCGYVVPDPYRVINSFEYSKGPDKLEELGLQEVSICEFNEGALAWIVSVEVVPPDQEFMHNLQMTRADHFPWVARDQLVFQELEEAGAGESLLVEAARLLLHLLEGETIGGVVGEGVECISLIYLGPLFLVSVLPVFSQILIVCVRIKGVNCHSQHCQLCFLCYWLNNHLLSLLVVYPSFQHSHEWISEKPLSLDSKQSGLLSHLCLDACIYLHSFDRFPH